jgi:hypothetical protein
MFEKVAEKIRVNSRLETLPRRALVMADYFLGSVHAITDSGEILVASGSAPANSLYSTLISTSHLTHLFP